MTTPVASRRVPRADARIALVLAVTTCLAAYWAAGFVRPYVLHYSTFDFWFESDPPAFLDQMESVDHDHHFRSRRHPLWSLLTYPAVQTIAALPGVSLQEAMSALMALLAAGWIVTVFGVLRLAGLSRVNATVFSVLAGVAACSVFWLPVPESYMPGAFSIGLAVLVVAASARGVPVPFWACVAVSILTLSITTTNWTIGLVMLALALPWRRALAAVLLTIAVVWAAWWIQKKIFIYAGSPLEVWIASETKYLLNPESSGLLAKLFAFFCHAIVAPALDLSYGFRLSIQARLPGEGSMFAAMATVVWGVLAAVGSWGLTRVTARTRLVAMLLLSLLCQLVITIAFGIETFLYSLHWGPLLVVAVAIGSYQLSPRWSAALGAALVIVGGYTNAMAFRDGAARLTARYEQERRFTYRVETLTAADDVIVCGRHAAAALGEPTAPAGQDTDTAEIEDIGRHIPTDACYFGFDRAAPPRRGWVLSYEDWTLERIDILRQRGARYFVSPYQYALSRGGSFLDAMDRTYRLIERTPDWVFYDLTMAAAK